MIIRDIMASLRDVDEAAIRKAITGSQDLQDVLPKELVIELYLGAIETLLRAELTRRGLRV